MGCIAALGTQSLFPISLWEKLTSVSWQLEIGHIEPRCLDLLFARLLARLHVDPLPEAGGAKLTAETNR